MPEQYELAAWRHYRVAELLEQQGEFDDSGYHYGVCAENVVKYALWASGVQNAWIGTGAAAGKTPEASLRGTPMRAHFPTLGQLVVQAQAEIAVNAAGRFAPTITAFVLSPSFPQRFAGWSINIRYADTSCTPVTPADCARWHADADDLIVGLL